MYKGAKAASKPEWKVASSLQGGIGESPKLNATEYSSRSSSSLGHHSSDTGHPRHYRMDSRDTTGTAQTSIRSEDRGRSFEKRREPVYHRWPDEPPRLADPWSEKQSGPPAPSFVAQLGSLPISRTVQILSPSPLDNKWDAFLRPPDAPAPYPASSKTKSTPSFQRAKSASFSDLRSAANTQPRPAPAPRRQPIDASRTRANIQYTVKNGLCTPYIMRKPRLTNREDSFFGGEAVDGRRNSFESNGTSVRGILQQMDATRQERDRWNRPPSRRQTRRRARTEATRPDVRIRSKPLCLNGAPTTSPTLGMGADAGDPFQRPRNRSMSFSRMFRSSSARKRAPSRDVGVQTDDRLLQPEPARRPRSNSHTHIRPTPLPVIVRRRSSSFSGQPSFSSSEHHMINWGHAVSSPIETLALDLHQIPSRPTHTSRESDNSIRQTKQGLFYTIPSRPVPVPDVAIGESGIDTESFGPPKAKQAGSSAEPLPLLAITSSPLLRSASPDSRHSREASDSPGKVQVSEGRVSTDTHRSEDFRDLFFRPSKPATPLPPPLPLHRDSPYVMEGTTRTDESSPTFLMSTMGSSRAGVSSPVTSVASDEEPETATKSRPMSLGQAAHSSTDDWVDRHHEFRDSREVRVYDFVTETFPDSRQTSLVNPYEANYKNIVPELASLRSLKKRRGSIESAHSFIDLDDVSPPRRADRPVSIVHSEAGRSFMEDISPPTSPLAAQHRASGSSWEGDVRRSTFSVGASDSASQYRPRDSSNLRTSLAVPHEHSVYRSSGSSGQAGQSSVSLVSQGSESHLGSQLASFPAPPIEAMPVADPVQLPPSAPLPEVPSPLLRQQTDDTQHSLSDDSDVGSVYTSQTAGNTGASRSQLDLSGPEEFVTPAATLSDVNFFDSEPATPVGRRFDSYLDLGVSPERTPTRTTTPTAERRRYFTASRESLRPQQAVR